MLTTWRSSRSVDEFERRLQEIETEHTISQTTINAQFDNLKVYSRRVEHSSRVEPEVMEEFCDTFEVACHENRRIGNDCDPGEIGNQHDIPYGYRNALGGADEPEGPTGDGSVASHSQVNCNRFQDSGGAVNVSDNGTTEGVNGHELGQGIDEQETSSRDFPCNGALLSGHRLPGDGEAEISEQRNIEEVAEDTDMEANGTNNGSYGDGARLEDEMQLEIGHIRDGEENTDRVIFQETCGTESTGIRSNDGVRPQNGLIGGASHLEIDRLGGTDGEADQEVLQEADEQLLHTENDSGCSGLQLNGNIRWQGGERNMHEQIAREGAKKGKEGGLVAAEHSAIDEGSEGGGGYIGVDLH